MAEFWDDNQIWIDGISDSCRILKGNSGRVSGWKDVLIGEVAKKHALILITNDNAFRKKARAVKIKTISFDEFLIQ